MPRRAYNVVFFGGIYEYKERFEAESIQGGYTEGAEPRDYVRVVNVDDNVIGRKAFQGILEERVLSRVPMFPEGPRIEKIQDPVPGLKLSSDQSRIEIFNRE